MYENDIHRCQICHCVHESNGTMASMKECHHTYHIACLIEYAISNERSICPECSKDFYDIRVSVAVAFKQGNTRKFIDALIE